MKVRQGLKETLFFGSVGGLLVLLPFLLARVLLSGPFPENALSNPRTDTHIQAQKAQKPALIQLSKILGKDYNPLQPVPRLFMASLPEDLSTLKSAKKRKQQFIVTLLPIILRANELLHKDRETAITLRDRLARGRTLSKNQKKWLLEQMNRFRLPEKKRTIQLASVNALLDRLDTIPPSLAMAQAAIESGWGTSFFSQQGNALFGEWVWGDEEGILPRGRETGKTHRIKKFDYLLDSVLSYMINLNRHPAYQDLRDRRSELRQHHLDVTGRALAPSLIKYSTRRAAYVNDILTIINYNGLDTFDYSRLADTDFSR